jgi:fructosamine-3-kinase
LSTRVDLDTATRLVRRHVDENLSVIAVRPLHGGMINHCCELITDGRPGGLVAKFNDADMVDAFRREFSVLQWYRRHTAFPVPRPYACFDHDAGFGQGGILMERIDGTNLADARLSERGRRAVQRDLARHVAMLHTHTRPTYGWALDPAEKGHTRWLDAFEPTMRREFDAVRGQLSSRTRSIIASVLDRLDEWIPEAGLPTLVHGDLWSTNILVDDRHPDRSRVLAFIDCGASYCDPEYELAYLRIFRTADDTFFHEYARLNPRYSARPGFDRRCRIYWLNTIMLHVRLFGDQYLARCEDLAQQVRQLS